MIICSTNLKNLVRYRTCTCRLRGWYDFCLGTCTDCLQTKRNFNVLVYIRIYQLDISMQDYDDRYITSDTSVSISLVGQTRIGLFSLAHCATPLQKASTSSISHQNIYSLEQSRQKLFLLVKIHKYRNPMRHSILFCKCHLVYYAFE